jgi:putative peptidoglycan lipid II flippase
VTEQLTSGAVRREPVLKQGGLLKSSAVVGMMTLLSRVLGLVRDIVFARLLGADGTADAFNLAFKVPNFLRRLFSEGAFSQAFVPVLSEYRTQRGFDEVRALIDRVAGALGGTLLVLTGVVLVTAPWVTMVFAAGFRDTPEQFALTVELFRIMFPYLFLISMAGFVGAILNSYGRFAVPALTPVWLNVIQIAAATVAAPYFPQPVYALAWGAFVAGCIQLVFQLPFVARLHLLPRPRLDLQHEGVRRILRLMVPALFGVSVSQINLLLDAILASYLPEGSVTWLYYAERMSELPLGIFAIAISTVILPSLSRKNAERSAQDFARTMDWAIRLVLLIGLPSMVAFVVLAEPILMTLFQGGRMTAADIAMSALSLQALAIGLVAFMLVKVLAPGFYAKQDLRTPVRIGIIAMVSNMVLNLMLVWPLHHYLKLGHVGLSLATTLSAFINAGLLWRGLRASGSMRWQPGSLSQVLRFFLSAIGMGVLLWCITPTQAVWQALPAWQRAGLLGGLCVAGVVSYFGMLLACGLRPRQFRGLS